MAAAIEGMTEVFVGVGSNEARERNLRAGLALLRETFGDLRCSSVYESEAAGGVGARYYNLVVAFHSALAAADVASGLRAIETACGRQAPRAAGVALDLDLLLYGECVDQALRLPRAEILDHAWVLRPLAELAGDRLHPLRQQTFACLWAAFAACAQPTWKVPVDVGANGRQVCEPMA